MPVWRCPHCATPQAETSRCWVCRRSTTSCATCRHFRRGIAGGLGVCGLNPRRVALTGTEMRACWAGPPGAAPVAVTSWAGVSRARVPGDAAGRGYATGAATAATVSGALAAGRVATRPRTFVPVDEPEPVLQDADELPQEQPVPVTRIPGTWWLWGDPEPWPET